MTQSFLRSIIVLGFIFFFALSQARAEGEQQPPNQETRPSQPQPNAPEGRFGIIFFNEQMTGQRFESEKRIFDNVKGESAYNYMLAATISSREVKPSLLLGLSNQHYKDEEKKFNINQRSFFFGAKYKLFEIAKDLYLIPGGAIHLMNFDIESMTTNTKEFFDPAAAEVNLGLLWYAKSVFSISIEVFRIEGFGFNSNGARVGLGIYQ